MPIALDATYSLGRNLSGVGVYSREILFGLASAHPEHRFFYYYRPHRFFKSFRDPLPSNASRRLLIGSPSGNIFHALNQRMDQRGQSSRSPRVVTTFHDLFVMTSEYSTPEFRARFTQQAKDAAQRSDLIIAVSQFTADQVEALLKIERSRIRVVHHGATPTTSATPMSRDRQGADPSPIPEHRDHIILFVGALQRRKNIARLVQAFERMPHHPQHPWRLVLAGAADGYGAAEELSVIEASPRRSQIDVLGYVSAADLNTLHARASIFAFPSLDEGFGMPVLDAMARGIPVVTSSTSALPEVAGDAALLVDPQDVEALSAALTHLATDEALRVALAARGRARAQSFPWSVAIEKTWDIYQELGL